MPVIEVEEWPVRRDFGLNVARGGVQHHEVRHIFGYKRKHLQVHTPYLLIFKSY